MNVGQRQFENHAINRLREVKFQAVLSVLRFQDTAIGERTLDNTAIIPSIAGTAVDQENGFRVRHVNRPCQDVGGRAFQEAGGI
jgi:hypothetical protein